VFVEQSTITMIGILIKFSDAIYQEVIAEKGSYAAALIDMGIDFLTEALFLITRNNYYLIFLNLVELTDSTITFMKVAGWI
jgi:hypothetical protein